MPVLPPTPPLPKRRVVFEPRVLKPPQTSLVPAATADGVLLKCILAGFANSKVEASGVSASKPDWEVGAAAALPKPPPAAGGRVLINAMDLADDDLVDEDDLLANDAVVLPDPAGGGGCATKKRACKDCSCGRAEMEAANPGSVEEPATSACGNCSKGDAFRCASCPHLGTPAFEKGANENVQLNLSQDDFS